MLSLAATVESSMSKAGLDNRHRNQSYGQSFASGYPATEKLSEVLLQLNETSLSQVRRDYETGLSPGFAGCLVALDCR
jgi:ribonuclease HII